MCYWGHRFEGYATCPRDGSPPVPDAAHVTNTNVVLVPHPHLQVAFCTVVRTRLAGRPLVDRHACSSPQVLGAEVDCERNGAYLELKTSQVPQYFSTATPPFPAPLSHASRS